MTPEEYLKKYKAKHKNMGRTPIVDKRHIPREMYNTFYQELLNIKDGEVKDQLPPEKVKKLKWGEKIIKRTVIMRSFFKKRRRRLA